MLHLWQTSRFMPLVGELTKKQKDKSGKKIDNLVLCGRIHLSANLKTKYTGLICGKGLANNKKIEFSNMINTCDQIQI